MDFIASPSLSITDGHVPLRIDECGVVRVGRSQVLLDIVIREHKRGVRPEEIVRAYSTLELADVYGAVAYYLSHQDEVNEYLKARREEAERLRQEITATQGNVDLRAELLKRKAQAEHAHAAACK